MSGVKTNLAFKITNWCNLQCRHCCENSGPNQSQHLMELDKIKKYMGEFRTIPIDKDSVVSFTGGEVMTPYFIGDEKYIQDCIKIAFNNGFTPALKTNGVWGANEPLRYRILAGIVDTAISSNKLVEMDISVDRFHNNFGAVAEILNTVLKEPILAQHLVITLQGLYKNSAMAARDLYMALLSHHIDISVKNDTANCVLLTNGSHDLQVYYNFNQAIADFGRAAENKLGTFKLTGKSDIFGDCVMIDADDRLRLNVTRAIKIKGRPLDVCIQKLKEKTK